MSELPGATAVAMSEADAQRIGLDYTKGQPVQMNTANGTARAYRLSLNSVRVGDVEVYDVDAVVSQQPMPYVPEQVPVLTAKETDMARSLFSSKAAPCLKCHATGDPAHDKTATAPNFLLAKERLKPDWVERWVLDPQAISPGTSMPSGLFKKDDKNHWVFAGPTPDAFNGYDKDHNKLLTNYIFQLTPEEQKRVSAGMGRATSSVAKPGKSNAGSAKVGARPASTSGVAGSGSR